MSSIILYNQNCFNVLPHIIDNRVDVSFTSVPYNRKRNDKYALYNDTIADYYGFLKESVSQMLRVTKRNVFFNIQQTYYNKADVFRLMGEFSNDIVDVFTWVKSNPTPARHHITTNSYEWFIVFGEPLRAKSENVRNVITTNVSKNIHPSHKGVMHQDVSDFFISNYVNENDIVLDPFIGLGTTAISCLKVGANCIGCEIVPEYCNIMLERIPEAQLVKWSSK